MVAVWSLWFVTALSRKYNSQAWLNMSFIQVTWSRFCGWQKFSVSVLPLVTILAREKSERSPKSYNPETPCCVPWTGDSIPPSLVRPVPLYRCTVNLESPRELTGVVFLYWCVCVWVCCHGTYETVRGQISVSSSLLHWRDSEVQTEVIRLGKWC